MFNHYPPRPSSALFYFTCFAFAPFCEVQGMGFDVRLKIAKFFSPFWVHGFETCRYEWHSTLVSQSKQVENIQFVLSHRYMTSNSIFPSARCFGREVMYSSYLANTRNHIRYPFCAVNQRFRQRYEWQTGICSGDHCFPNGNFLPYWHQTII